MNGPGNRQAAGGIPDTRATLESGAARKYPFDHSEQCRALRRS